MKGETSDDARSAGDSNEHQRTLRGMDRWIATCGDEEEDSLAQSWIADKQDGVAKNDAAASNLASSQVKSTQK